MRDSLFQIRSSGLGKLSLMLCWCALLSITTHIKTASSQTAIVPPVIAQLNSVLPKHCRFAGTFVQTKNLSGLPIPLHSSGTFLFDCELGLIWHTHQPVPETRVYTQQDLHFQIDANDDIENKDSVIQLYIADLLLGIMSADHDFIASNFSPSTKPLTTNDENTGTVASQNGLNSSNITLLPTSAFLKKGLNSLHLHKTTQQLTLSLLDNKNQTTTISSTETARYATQQQSIDACIELFPTRSICAVLTDPSTYAELSNNQANQ